MASLPSAHRRPSSAEAARRLRDLLRSEVLGGRLGGFREPLPSEVELMAEFGASRQVVRDALALMRSEGLVARVQGAGTFVVATKLHHRFDHVHGIVDSAPDHGRRVACQVLSTERVAAPAIVARHLELSKGGTVVLVEALISVDGTPYSLGTSWLVADLAPAVGALAELGDWYAALEVAGRKVVGASLRAEAVLADEAVAGWLAVPAGAPLLLFERVIASEDGEPLEYGFVRCRGDRVVIESVLPRAPLGGTPVRCQGDRMGR